jgi:uncharacterized protein (DUF1697 family)
MLELHLHFAYFRRMTTYIALLRGINVSGQKKILMSDLKNLMEELGYHEVGTYIQSGNIIFNSSDQSENDIAKHIKDKIFDIYQFDVKVMVMTHSYLLSAIEANPFLKRKDVEMSKVHFTFLDALPTAEAITKLRSYNYTPDEFELVNQVLYVYCPESYGNTKLSNSFIENKLKVDATSRNYRTTNILSEMSS